MSLDEDDRINDMAVRRIIDKQLMNLRERNRIGDVPMSGVGNDQFGVGDNEKKNDVIRKM